MRTGGKHFKFLVILGKNGTFIATASAVRTFLIPETQD
jgi:hypothetical protein